MLHLRITAPADLTDQVLQVLDDDPAVSSLAVLRGASIRPEGDIVLADVAREAANDMIDALEALEVPQRGTVHLEPVTTWLSEQGLDCGEAHPGQQRGLRRLGRRDPARLRGVRAELDLHVLHDPGHAAGQHRDHRRLPDPCHRCDGAGPRVRRHRGLGPGPGSPPSGAGVLRRQDAAGRVLGRHRNHHTRCARRSRPGLDHRPRTSPVRVRAPTSSTHPTSGRSSWPSSPPPQASCP